MNTQNTLRASLWIASLALLTLTGCKETTAPQTSGLENQDHPVVTAVTVSRDDSVQSSGGSQSDASERYEQSVCIGETTAVTISTGGHYENRSDFFLPTGIPAGISALIPTVEESSSNGFAALVDGDEKQVHLC